MEKINPSELSRYSIRRTRNGLITYLLDGKRIPKRDVPKHLLEHIPYPEVTEDTHVSSFYVPGYSYLQGYGNMKLYYHEGVRIQKSRIPKDKLENIINAQTYWNDKWEEARREAQAEFERTYRAKYTEESKKPTPSPPTEDAPGPAEPKTYPAYIKMTPSELLLSENIHSRSDWKKWMLKNHPDKNPNSDQHHVALVNAAVHILYPS